MIPFKITKYNESDSYLYVCIISKNNPVSIQHTFTAEEMVDEESKVRTIERLIAELSILDEEYTPSSPIVSKLLEAQDIVVDHSNIEVIKEQILIDRGLSSIDNPPSINKFFEQVIDEGWIYNEESNTRVKSYKVELLSFEAALTLCAYEVDRNRTAFEVGGIPYVYNGINVLILTDKESSQPKLISGQVSSKPIITIDPETGLAIEEGSIRKDTDVWKFGIPGSDGMYVFQVPNQEILNISAHVYRVLQDAYNLQCSIFYQMLGCGDTRGLKEAIEAGEISLNPWV